MPPPQSAVLVAQFLCTATLTPFATFDQGLARADSARVHIEDLNLNPPVSVLLIFASPPDCSQNQIAVSDKQQSLSDF
jgi:hypothetical protein